MTSVPGGAYTSLLAVRMRSLVARPRLRSVRHGLGHGAPGEQEEVEVERSS